MLTRVPVVVNSYLSASRHTRFLARRVMTQCSCNTIQMSISLVRIANLTIDTIDPLAAPIDLFYEFSPHFRLLFSSISGSGQHSIIRGVVEDLLNLWWPTLTSHVLQFDANWPAIERAWSWRRGYWVFVIMNTLLVLSMLTDRYDFDWYWYLENVRSPTIVSTSNSPHLWKYPEISVQKHLQLRWHQRMGLTSLFESVILVRSNIFVIRKITLSRFSIQTCTDSSSLQTDVAWNTSMEPAKWCSVRWRYATEQVLEGTIDASSFVAGKFHPSCPLGKQHKPSSTRQQKPQILTSISNLEVEFIRPLICH